MNRLSQTARSPFAWLLPIGILLLAGCSGSKLNKAQYATATVSRGHLQQHVTATGSLSAVVSVDVGSRVSGEISALYVDFNSPVKKGQLVAEIDPTLYAAALRQAEGDLAGARADVVLKQQNLERKKILLPLHAASQLDLDQATADLAQSQATVTIKVAALESARANLGYCKITAPVDGIVISRKVDKGQTVIAAMSTPVLFTVAQDISKMNITADVSEADIGHVQPGQSVTFTVDAFPDSTFEGQVSQVRKSPTTTQNVVTYQTLITVANPEQKLFPGMTADVSILVADYADVLKVANAALRFTPPPNAVFETAPPTSLARTQQLAYRLDPGGKLQPLVVTTGISDGLNTQIQSGVGAGVTLVTSLLTAVPARATFGPPTVD